MLVAVRDRLLDVLREQDGALAGPPTRSDTVTACRRGRSSFPRHSTQPTPSGASPNLCPEVLMDLTRGILKSQMTSGAQNGARKAPDAPSTWMQMSSPVSA